MQGFYRMLWCGSKLSQLRPLLTPADTRAANIESGTAGDDLAL